VGGNNDIGDVCSYINGTEGVERGRELIVLNPLRADHNSVAEHTVTILPPVHEAMQHKYCL
jgi:hypothetical protein